MKKPARLVVGLMSGTSVDGIDAALCRVEGHRDELRAEVLAWESFQYPDEIRELIFRQFRPSSSSVDEICYLDFAIGELYAEATLALLKRTGNPPEEVDLIGTAGQTVWHDPTTMNRPVRPDWSDRVIETRSTLAIGQGGVVAERTGIPTISNLRVRDVAAGGHGAPLIAYADWLLLTDPDKGRCVQNIGGIANVTFLPAAAALEQVIAFDTGPGNMVIDALAETATGGRQKFDRDGEIAASGKIDVSLLHSLLADPYFELEPPKTTGRERFGSHFAARILAAGARLPIEDVVATATALTAKSIAYSYRQFVLPLGEIDEVIVGGGGAENPVLMSMLEAELPDMNLLRHEDIGIDSQVKEALAIAVIANDAAAGLTTNVPGATGGRPTVLGALSL